MKKQLGIPALSIILLLVLSIPVFGNVSGDISSNITESRGERLAREFAENLNPESMKMVLSEEPDDEGRVHRLYLKLSRPLIGGVRIAELEVEAHGIKFTAPSSWTEKPVDMEEILHVKAWGRLKEEDINSSLLQQEFGEEERWHDLYLDFTEKGLVARGYYLARVLMFRFDILIEITGELGIVNKQQIWLENYSVSVNRVGLPEGLTEKAISKIQPILDLSKFIFPLQLHSVEMDDSSVVLRSRVKPEEFQGLTYNYNSKEDSK